MSLLIREANEISLIRRLNDYYHLFLCENPDLCGDCALDSDLVGGNHVDGSPPAKPGSACCH
jgi:hypothetical protein